MTRKKGRPRLTRSETMARVRSKDTGPEMLVRAALWNAGIRYRLHVHLPGTPDLALMRHRVAVFVDGCFWHGCPLHYSSPGTNARFWQAKVARNMERDRCADAALAELGWTVVRVWEHEVDGDLPLVVARVQSAIGGGREGLAPLGC